MRYFVVWWRGKYMIQVLEYFGLPPEPRSSQSSCRVLHGGADIDESAVFCVTHMRTTFESSVFLLLTVQGTSCTQEQQSYDAREGVFFAKEQFPSTGVVANKLSTPAELAERVASWKTAYTPGPLTYH